MGKTDNIKTRKQLEQEYISLYGNVSEDSWESLKEHLGDRLNQELFKRTISRYNEIKNNMTYSQIKFTFYEVPIQAHRPRVNFRTRGMRTPNARDNSDAIEKLIKKVRKELVLISTPMKVILNAYFPMPKNIKDEELILYQSKHQFAIGKPDFDNVLKAYCDAIQNHIILDDDLVCSCEFNKYFNLKPKVELTIIFMDNYDAEYVYKKIKSRKKFKEQEERIKSELLVPFSKRGKKK